MIAVTRARAGSTRLISRALDPVRPVVRRLRSHRHADGRYLLRATLDEIERRWEQFGFIRVHRQYVANLARAVELRPLLGGTAELAFADGQSIPVARRHVADLSRRLGV